MLDSSFDEAHKRRAVVQKHEESKGYRMRGGSGHQTRKHSVAGSGGTSSQSAAGYSLNGGGGVCGGGRREMVAGSHQLLLESGENFNLKSMMQSSSKRKTSSKTLEECKRGEISSSSLSRKY